jgi:H+/Cl- antiporter ClcA
MTSETARQAGSEQRKTAEEREESRIDLLTLLAVFIGLGAGIIALFIRLLIGLLTNVAFYGRFSFAFSSPQYNHLGVFVVVLPALGGLIAGVMIKYGSHLASGDGISEAIESVLLQKSRIPPRTGLMKPLSASFTIGLGEPFGPEGPIIQTGGALGSLLGQLISVTSTERRILVAAGAGAGLAAAFGTPISGVFLAIELFTFEFRVKSLVPIAIASAIGGWMHIMLITPLPLFSTPGYAFGGLNILPFYALLGACAGIVGVAITRGLHQAENGFEKLHVGQPWLPAIGGLLVGVIALYVPQVLGAGYDVISSVLAGQIAISLAVVILVAKAGAWILALGSRTSGGTLAPLFMVGSCLGLVFGWGVVSLFPNLGISPAVFAIASMAAVFGTMTRAPYTSIVFAVEATENYQALLPVIVTVVIAELVGEYLMDDSMVTHKMTKRGYRIRHIYEYNPLRQLKVTKIMSPPATVDSKEKVVDVFREIIDPKNELSRKETLIVVKDGKAIGVVARHQLYEGASQADREMTVEQACSKSFLTVSQEEYGYEAMRIMTQNNSRPKKPPEATLSGQLAVPLHGLIAVPRLVLNTIELNVTPPTATMKMTAMRRDESPIRVMTNAFSPAFLAAGLSLQNAMRRAEQTPTSSQKK